MNIKRQRGVTLLELILVIGLMSSALMFNMLEKKSDLEVQKAREVGNRLHEYNNAVRAWVSSNPSALPGIKNGSRWLKDSACGGTASKAYLPCDFPEASTASPMPFGRLALQSEIEATGVAPDRIVTVTTSTSPFTLNNGDVRSDLAGISAISAAAGANNASTPVMMATNSSYRSDPSTASIVLTASNSPANDAWLRTDGSNTMNAPIRFSTTSPANMRQLQHVSRIQSLASEAFYIGSLGGASSGQRVVVDASEEILGTLLLKNAQNNAVALEIEKGDIVASGGSVRASGNVQAAGSLRAGTTIQAVSSITAGTTITSGSSITAGTNILAQGNVQAISSINAGSNVNANGNVTAGGSISATGNLTAGGNAYAQRFYDSQNSSYYLDPNALSNLYAVTINQNMSVAGSSTFSGRTNINEYLMLNRVVAASGSCSPNGIQARDAAGGILSCISGRWGSAGGGSFGGSFTTDGSVTPTASPYLCRYVNKQTGYCTCPSGYAASPVGKWDYGGDDFHMGFVCQK